MKKGIFFGAICAAVLFIATFAACSSNEEPLADEGIDFATSTTSGFDGFMASIDSLNTIYTLQSRANTNTALSTDDIDVSKADTRLTKNKLVSYADQAGTCAGIAAGITLTAAGSAASCGTLSTVAAMFGIAAPAWYSHYYSAITKLATRCWGYSVSTPKLNSISTIRNRVDDSYDGLLDSIGVRHNRLMVNLDKYDKKYISLNLLDRNVQMQFYSDFLKEMKELYPEFNGMEPSESDRDNLISKAIDILRIAQKNIDKPDYYTCFVNDTYDLFTKKYNISKEDARILKDYTTTLYSQCEKLDGYNLERYAKDLDKVIDDSDLDMEEKLAITSVSKISINSYLCWKD